MGEILLGSLGAVVLRVVLAAFVVYLLQIPFLKIVGSVLLFWIAVKLLLPEQREGDAKSHEAATLWAAVRTVIIADAVMSLDNVIAIAAVAKGSLVLLSIGLVISVPLIVYGSTLILRALERYPILVKAGGALLGYVAADVLLTDPALIDWVPDEPTYLAEVMPLAGIVLVLLAFGLMRLVEQRRGKVDLIS